MTSDETTLQQSGGNSPAPIAYDPNEFWLRTLLRWYIGLVIRPVPTIREIVERRPPLRFGLVTVIWGILVSLGASSVSVWLLDRPEGLVFPPGQTSESWVAVVVLLAGICGVVASYAVIWATMLHWIGKIFRNSGDLKTTMGSMMLFLAVAFALISAGMIIVGIGYPQIEADIRNVEDVVSYSGLGLATVGLLWVAALGALLLRQTHQVGKLAAAITVVASLLPTFILGYLVMFFWLAVGVGILLLAGEEVRLGN